MGGTMILCECGELIKDNTFKEYIQTSMNPSTRTIGHTSCGMIFNFIDGKRQKKYLVRSITSFTLFLFRTSL